MKKDGEIIHCTYEIVSDFAEIYLHVLVQIICPIVYITINKFITTSRYVISAVHSLFTNLQAMFQGFRIQPI